jgi:hypothetical protein
MAGGKRIHGLLSPSNGSDAERFGDPKEIPTIQRRRFLLSVQLKLHRK